MLRSIAIAALVALSASAYAQLTLSGVVYDATGNQPLPGASVQMNHGNSGAVTDSNGHFSVENLNPGDYDVTVSFVGYENKTTSVTLVQSVVLDFKLAEKILMTDEVVVYATRANDKTPTTFSNIDKATIQKQNFGQDLPFLLNWTPSLVTTSDAGAGVGYTGFRIRGSDATRINVTINGIPYNDAESQGTYWVDVPDVASSSQSIQIQRGVGTSTNGSGAFGASVNLTTNSRNDKPYGTLINSGGSFGTHRHTVGFGSGLLNDHWVIDGRVSKINSDGYIDRATSALQSYYFSTGFYSGKTMIKAIVFGGKERTYQAWYGVPESRLKNNPEGMEATVADEGWNDTQRTNLFNSSSRTFNPYTYKNQVDDYKQDHYQLHFSHGFSDALTANVSLHYTKGKGYYEEYRYNDALSNYGLSPVTIGDSTISSMDLIRRRWLDNDFYGTTYSITYDRNRLNLILGGAFNRYVGDHFGEIIWAQVSAVPTEYRYYSNRSDKRDYSSYLKGTYQLTSKLSAFADLQLRQVNFDMSGKENKQNTFDLTASFKFFNPKAGLTYSFSDKTQLYASYAVANREPVRDDFVDAHFRTKPIAPKAETLHNIEVGYRTTGKRYTLSANYYLMDYKNQLVLTGAVNDVGSSLRTNVKSSYRTGVELDGALQVTKFLRWNANITLSKNKIKTFTEVLYDYGVNWDEYNEVKRNYKNTDIAFSPNVIAGSGLTFIPFKQFDVTFLTKYVGKQYLDNTSNSKRSIDAYVVNDVRISYTWTPHFIKEIGFSLLLNNILSEKYSSNGYTWGYLAGPSESRQNYFYPQAGRNFLAMVTLKF